MGRNKLSKILISFFLLLCLVFSAYSVYPQVVFSQGSFPSGQVDVNLQSSSGLKVSLYVNGNFIGQKDSVKSQRDVYLTNDISDETIAVSQNLRFINNNSLRTYPLNFTTGTFQSLSFGENMIFKSNSEGFVDYTDENAGVTRTITVQDQMVSLNFTNINSNYLVDGTNTISFIYYSLQNSSKLGEKNQTFNYDKYSNKINANTSSIINTPEAVITGTVTNPSAPLFFVLNNNGVIGNLGQLRLITLNGSSFSIRVSSLNEGNNSIRFISVDPVNNQIFNGEKIINVFVDTIEPTLEIKSATYSTTINGKSANVGVDMSSEAFINGGTLKLNITSDAVNITSLFNGKNTTYNVVNGTVAFDLSLVRGKNNLTLTAYDIAGNIYKEAHAINFDSDQINLKNITPKSGSTVHFFIQDFEGYVNKADVEITAFAIPRNAKVWNPETNSDKAVSCTDYSFLGVRDLGQLRRTVSYTDSQYKADDLQISLTSIISDKIIAKSDGSGKFKVENLILHEDSFTTTDTYNMNGTATQSPRVGDVKSPNIICFVLSDKFGNTITKDISLTLDNGNTQWRAGEITTTPNTIYSAEIEQTGNERSGNGKVRFGVIAKLQYIGGGQLTNVQGVMVSNDGSANDESRNIRIVTSELKYRADPNTNEMLVYFPVEVSPLGKKPLDYPKELKFHFKAQFSYYVNDKSIPIDTTNPVYFFGVVNVEKPLDHSKWLTPEMIDKSLALLNKSITYTKKATDVLGIASVGGVLTCTGAKFYHAYEISGIMTNSALSPEEKQKKKAEADRNLYMICDRIACTNSPPESNLKDLDNQGYTKLKGDGLDIKNSGLVTNDKFEGGLSYYNQEGLVTGELKDITFLGDCKYTDSNGVQQPGVNIQGTLLKYEKEVSDVSGAVADVKGESRLRKVCVPAKVETTNIGNTEVTKVKSIDFNSVTGAKYSPGYPKFDDTRCNFFWADDGEGTPQNNWKGAGVSDRSPSSSIISSVRCGCVTDTYSHLKNWLKIQQGIQMCLMQAKIGQVKGSYCERLMSQAVCDVATNVVLPEIERNIKPGSPSDSNDERNPFGNFLGSMRATDREMNQRYSGTFLSQAGLSTDQLVNKACVAAITGDWSVLTDNILTAIDKNEVDPVFGPPFPESRLQGYNPITGTISIRYMFTYGVISGGQQVQTTVELMCDKNSPNGEYCPEDGIITSTQVPNGEFKTKTLNVNKGGTVQDTVIINEEHARFWYNKLKVTHKYTIKGEVKTREEQFMIVHKSESLLANCYFSGGTLGSGATFKCDSIFGEDALISSFSIDKTKTRIVPGPSGATSTTTAVLYPGNKLLLDLSYSSRNVDSVSTEEVYLAYMAVCPNGENKDVILGKGAGQSAPFKTLLSSGTPTDSKKLFDLFTIPEPSTDSAGTSKKVATSSFKADPNKKYYLKFTSTSGTDTVVVDELKVYLQTSSGEVKVADIRGNVVIPQNLNINSQNPSVQEKYVELNMNGNDGYVVIESQSPFNNNVAVSVVYSGTTNNMVSVTSFKNINTNIKDGASCKLKLRVLPGNQIEQITVDNFDSYSGVSKNFTNAISTDVVTIPFIVKSKPINKVEYFELTGMSDGAYICLSLDGNGKLSDTENINLNYVYQNSESTAPSGSINLKYTLSANQYGVLNTKDQSKTLTDMCDSNLVTLDIAKGMKEQLEKAQEDSVAQNWIFGTSNTIEGKLSYTAESTNNGKTITLNKKDIKVYFVASKSCPAKQTVTCENTLVTRTCRTDDTNADYNCYCDPLSKNLCYLDQERRVRIKDTNFANLITTSSTEGQTTSSGIGINNAKNTQKPADNAEGK